MRIFAGCGCKSSLLLFWIIICFSSLQKINRFSSFWKTNSSVHFKKSSLSTLRTFAPWRGSDRLFSCRHSRVGAVDDSLTFFSDSHALEQYLIDLVRFGTTRVRTVLCCSFTSSWTNTWKRRAKHTLMSSQSYKFTRGDRSSGRAAACGHVHIFTSLRTQEVEQAIDHRHYMGLLRQGADEPSDKSCFLEVLPQRANSLNKGCWSPIRSRNCTLARLRVCR